MDINQLTRDFNIEQIHNSYGKIFDVNLSEYSDKNKTTLFVGINKNDTRNKIKKHKGFCVIIWLKYDFEKSKKHKNIEFYKSIQNNKKIEHYFYNFKSITTLSIDKFINDNIVYGKLKGGLGNQLFMIFNTISVAKDYNKKYLLYFDKNYVKNYLKEKNVLRKSSDQYNLFKNLNFKDIGDDKLSTFNVFQEKEYKYNKIVLENNQGSYLLKGYYQSYKYFWHNIKEIKKHLFIDYNKIDEINNRFKQFSKPILAMHLRLTDYVGQEDYHPIPPLNYYKKALSYYDLDKYQIILFSDDIELAKEKTQTLNLDVIYADDLYKNDEEQFYMLCLSNVRICANSTFSLMSCYLNEMYSFVNDCEYIFPNKWFGPKGPKSDIHNLIPVENIKFKILNNTEENLKVSILIPTHDLKGEQINFMKKTLPIIFNQSYKNFEIIITDNNDKSDTYDFIYNNFKEYYLQTNPSRYNIDTFDINKIKHTYCKIKGWSPNHNHGIDFCTGDLIKILHQDNYFLNQFSLENIVAEFNINTDIKWMVSAYWHEYENNIGKLSRLHTPRYIDEIVNGENLIGDPSCLTIRRENVLKFNLNMQWLVDCEYYIRLKYKYGEPYILKNPNIVVYQHNNQVTHIWTIESKINEHILIRELINKYNMNVAEYPYWILNNEFTPNSKELYDKINKKKIINEIPIIIICYNNHFFVKQFIKNLLKVNKSLEKNIIIFDNCSKNKSTIKFLDKYKSRYKIWNSKENISPRITSTINSYFFNKLPRYFFLTDPDLLINKNLPKDFINFFYDLSVKYKSGKVGFALDISDSEKFLPGYFLKEKSIVYHEKKFWVKRIPNEDTEMYWASIDTTFSLIDKKNLLVTSEEMECNNPIRVAGNYTCKHIPWYKPNYYIENLNNYDYLLSKGKWGTTRTIASKYFNTFIDNIKIYVINLDNRIDRWNNIKLMFNKLNITNFERFSALKPTLKECLTEEIIDVYKFWKFTNLEDINNINYIKGASGCKLSHYNLLKYIKLTNKDKYFIIIEDDCALSENFKFEIFKVLHSIENKEIDFNILYLACSLHTPESYNVINYNLLKCKYGNGHQTHAMLFKNDKIDYLINYLEKSKVEIDNEYVKMENRYVIFPMIAFQKKSKSNITIYKDDEKNKNSYDDLEFGYDFYNKSFMFDDIKKIKK